MKDIEKKNIYIYACSLPQWSCGGVPGVHTGLRVRIQTESSKFFSKICAWIWTERESLNHPNDLENILHFICPIVILGDQ